MQEVRRSVSGQVVVKGTGVTLWNGSPTMYWVPVVYYIPSVIALYSVITLLHKDLSSSCLQYHFTNEDTQVESLDSLPKATPRVLKPIITPTPMLHYLHVENGKIWRCYWLRWAVDLMPVHPKLLIRKSDGGCWKNTGWDRQGKSQRRPHPFAYILVLLVVSHQKRKEHSSIFTSELDDCGMFCPCLRWQKSAGDFGGQATN